jgi:membrane-associated phospholipid phosphatase
VSGSPLRRAFGALAFALILAGGRAAGAQGEPVTTEPPAVAPASFGWNPAHPRFRLVEYIATAVVGGTAIVLFTAGTAADHANWEGPILFDEPVRDAVRLRGVTSLGNARRVGDVLTVAPIVYTTLVDSIIVPLARRSPDVAWQLTMMNAEAFALSGLVTSTMFAVVGRARPSYAECQAKTTDDPLCNSGTFADFPSGHTASAMTAAGLSCAHHLNVHLYGGAGDAVACAASITVGLGAGAMRLLGDRHYVSDVLAGGGIGFLVGYGLPSLLHYRERPLTEVHASAALRVALLPGSGASPLGASAVGSF